MKTKIISMTFASVFMLLYFSSFLPAQSVALTPTEKKDDWWVKRHAENVALMEKGDIELLMVGDSITHGWNGKVWDRYYKHRKPINMGFSGDRTEHVLWRLNNLPLDKISPKVAVIMIGTNNIGHNSTTPKESAEGIKAIVDKLGKQYPKMKILVLYVFPRDAKVDGGMRKKVDEINSYLPELFKDAKNVTLLDLNAHFLDADKNLPDDIMPDKLHPNEKGYWIWAEKMEPTLSKLLDDEAVKAEK